MARTFPTEGQAPIDGYTDEPDRPLMYLEKTDFSGAVFKNQVATIRANIPASGVTSGFACALVIRTDIGASATVPAMRGLYMYHCSAIAHTDGDASFIRFEDNSATAGYGMYAVLEYAGKASTTVGTEVFLYTTAGIAPWCSKTATCSNQAGHIKLNLGGTTKYIALYSTSA